MVNPERKFRHQRLLLPLVTLVSLLGLVVSLAWTSAGLAIENQPPPASGDCAQGERLSPRGAELLCSIAGDDISAVPFQARGATPVPAPDPLDGDPLDGPAQKERIPAPENAQLLDIVQSGRQKDTPNSTVLYDGDAETRWEPAVSGESWVWLDLGEAESVRNVQWLAAGNGEVEIAVSSDRKTWAVLDTQRITSDWQDVSLREDARYVRLTLLSEEDQSPPELAEVEIFGRERNPDVSLSQDAKKERGKKRDKRRAAERAQEAATTDDVSADDDDSGGERRSSVNASVKAGRTTCNGDRERCRAQAGRVEVIDDCDGDGTCTIDIRADGGTAVCDASGGEENRAGGGEGKRGGGDGGRCEAVADGGTVTIGDVNP